MHAYIQVGGLHATSFLLAPIFFLFFHPPPFFFFFGGGGGERPEGLPGDDDKTGSRHRLQIFSELLMQPLFDLTLNLHYRQYLSKAVIEY